MEIKDVTRDGNCLVYSILTCLGYEEKEVLTLRQMALEFLLEHEKLYKEYLGEKIFNETKRDIENNYSSMTEVCIKVLADLL